MIEFLTPDQLASSNFSRELIGAEHSDLPACAIVVDAAPGEGPRLHRHPYAELFFVLAGEASFSDGTVERLVGPGAIVIVQPQQPHAFVNSGTTRLRQIDIHLSSKFQTEWLG